MIDLLLDAFAAYRLTKLVTHDTITAAPRASIIEASYRAQALQESMTLSQRVGQPIRDMRPSDWSDLAISEGECAPKLATLITCRWCAGVYVAAFVVAARRHVPGWPWAARVLALSAASALIARAED